MHSENVSFPIDNNALGCPIRLDWPPARMIPDIMNLFYYLFDYCIAQSERCPRFFSQILHLNDFSKNAQSNFSGFFSTNNNSNRGMNRVQEFYRDPFFNQLLSELPDFGFASDQANVCCFSSHKILDDLLIRGMTSCDNHNKGLGIKFGNSLFIITVR